MQISIWAGEKYFNKLIEIINKLEKNEIISDIIIPEYYSVKPNGIVSHILISYDTYIKLTDLTLNPKLDN